jgi:hypothetical protein
MSALYEANFPVPLGLRSLDSYFGSDGEPPPDSFVATRKRDGTAKSLYWHPVWDFTAYSVDGKPARLVFSFWAAGNITSRRDAISKEIRFLVFALIWYREGSPLAFGTLQNYLTVLCALAEMSDERGVSLATVLGDIRLLRKFVSVRCGGWMAETFVSLHGNLSKLPEAKLGFKLAKSKDAGQLGDGRKAYRERLRQHPPMPMRIYSRYISALSSELSDWLAVADEMLELVVQCSSDPLTGRTVETQSDIATRIGLEPSFARRPTFDQCASSRCLEYIASKGGSPDVKGLSSLISQAQLIAKLSVQTFTGTRDEEAKSLPYDCLDTSFHDGKTHYRVCGTTTKLHHGLGKRAKWVTNQEGLRAIEAARAIADVIYGLLEVQPKSSDDERHRHALFVSPGYLRLGSETLEPRDGWFTPGNLYFRHDSRLREVLFGVITQADIQELEHIDPHRAWSSEAKFQLNERWWFTTHQLRRSLALYAQRSGLVSLPSLRRQLQHITEEMSRYYAKGAFYSREFIVGSKHFGLEWQATQPESAGLSYIQNVLHARETQTGGHAHWVQHRLKRGDGVVAYDRKETMVRFKKGELAYRETILGGCTAVDGCDKAAMNWTGAECLKSFCKSLVCSLSKLELVTAAQEKFVSALDRKSVEYRTELADLEVMKAARTGIAQ